MSTLYVIYNQLSGIDTEQDQLELELEKLQKQHTLYKLSIDEILDRTTIAKRITVEKPDTLIAIGGDGTVNAVANIAVRHDIRMLVVPTGTFNHFAKHFTLPKSDTALAVLSQGKTILVDTAAVNDVVFVNFVSIGLYAKIIAERIKKQREGFSKWYGFLKAFFTLIVRHTNLLVHFESTTTVKQKTPLLFIGNGMFDFGSLDFLASRSLSQDGKLQLTFVKKADLFPLLGLMFKSMIMDTTSDPQLTTIQVDTCTIALAQRKKTAVVVDGELLPCTFPLTFTSKPKSLKLLVPSDHPLN